MISAPKTIAAALAIAASATFAQAQTQGVTDTSVTIGMISDLSGPLASWGVPATNGATMRFDEQNAAGGVQGRQISFKVEDMQYQVPLAIRSTNRLVQSENVFAMILGVGTAQALSSFEITDRAGIPNILPMTGALAMAEPYHPLHIAYISSYRDQASAAIRHFQSAGQLQRVCLQTQTSEYGEEITTGVKLAVESLGLELVHIGTHRTTETEFAGAATALRNANCDLVYLGTTGRDTIALYVTLRQLEVKVPIVGNMVSYLPVVAQAASGAMEGFYVVSPLIIAEWDDGDAFRRDFRDRYVARFGEEPAVQAQVGYLGADLTIRAMEVAGKDLTVDSFMAGMESLQNVPDPFGGSAVSFSREKRFGISDQALMQVQNSAWVVLERGLPF
jgi:branched-chain amino acid transport system substrate-binding protein